MRHALTAIAAAMILWTVPAEAATTTNPVYEKLSRLRQVGIYLSPVQDATGKADPAAVKAAVEKALRERKSISFKIVDSTDADVRVEISITDYLYSDHDPVDMLMGTGAIAMDAIKKEHFARLIADVVVREAPTEKVLWQDRVMSTVTKEPMNEAEAKDLITADWAKTFIRYAFGKKLRK